MATADIPMFEGGSPIFGHLHILTAERISMIRTLAEREVELMELRMPLQRVVAVAGAQAAYDVLVGKAQSFEKSPIMRAALFPLAGDGLFTSEHDLWRKQRKLMAPIFRMRELHGFADAMAGCAERAVDSWKDGEVVDVAREGTRIAMSVAGKTLFDADTFSDADDLGEALTVALDWANDQFRSPILMAQTRVRTALLNGAAHVPKALADWALDMRERMNQPIMVPGERTKHLNAALDVLERRVKEMIGARRAAETPPQDLLTQLLAAQDESGANMSDKQVRDEILTLFVAGHETTASALAWSLYLLCKHPEAYKRAQAEADALTGDHVGFDDVKALPYCLRVFKEALRLYPPIYLFGRQAIADVEIAGKLVSRGTIMLMSPYVLHHREDLWPDHDKFDPERFLPEAEQARPREAFLPFSGGPRTCIGNHFALMEAPIVLATLLRRCDFSRMNDDEIPLHAAATLRPGAEIPMRITMRKQS